MFSSGKLGSLQDCVDRRYVRALRLGTRSAFRRELGPVSGNCKYEGQYGMQSENTIEAHQCKVK
jgi:hypothetical protein